MSSASLVGLAAVVVGSLVTFFLVGQTEALISGEGRTKHVSHPVERTQPQYTENAPGTGIVDHNGSLRRRSTLTTLGLWLLPPRAATTPMRPQLGPRDPVRAVPHPTSPQQAQLYI
ncbi:hypothetical protein M407DRAFT_21171 [Tulasnella calospora MUT 4182]|uniref:Uncharacterized protein n=1 Tax=Tulasnella calospora MUT 4182 TaxID=1051891 RepID=A0A0C3QQE0_9AGAM|nr:hypothetical protein M407DRAFT_21171 [Tulasnella calospora MUT 4182]